MTERVLKTGKFHYINKNGDRVVCRKGDVVDLTDSQLVAFSDNLEPLSVDDDDDDEALALAEAEEAEAKALAEAEAEAEALALAEAEAE